MLSKKQNKCPAYFKKSLGVTLIEVLLVMVIASSILLMAIGYMQSRTEETRRTRAALQLQQVLNAALAFYVSMGKWPGGVDSLVNTNFLRKPPSQLNIVNPWGQAIYGTEVKTTTAGVTSSVFYVYTDVRTFVNARIVSGRLPFGYVSNALAMPPVISTSCTAGLPCYAVSYVNIPGQNLNNATAVNFAGLFHSGACVPVPSCPVDKDGTMMVPQAYAVPASVSGINDAVCTGSGSSATCSAYNTYPLASVTARVLGPTTNNYTQAGDGPPLCESGNAGECYYDLSNAKLPGQQRYWRACLHITTERGIVAATNPAWGAAAGTILVFTRCATQTEATSAANSPYAKFEVWQQ